MKGRRLGALATLTDARAQRERRRLDGACDEHRRLERQRHELGEHVRRYQHETLEPGRELAVPLLLQRRGFIEQLARRVVALGEESRESERRVRESAASLRAAAARDTALGALRRRVEADEAHDAAREEQRQSDEATRSCRRSPPCAGRSDTTVSDDRGGRS